MGRKNEKRDIDRLAHELARLTGESVHQAVRRAIEERMARVKPRVRGRTLTENLEEVLSRVDDLPPVDLRTESDILH